jgi:phytoene dehydrogenase-like protein
MLPINHIDEEHPVDWEKQKIHMRKIVLNRLKEIGLKDIEKHIVFEASFTPPDWQQTLNLPFGSVYGLHHNIMQFGYLRPKRTHRKYQNLFFVGADTHPGSGLPTVLQSAQFTSERILNRFNEALY